MNAPGKFIMDKPVRAIALFALILLCSTAAPVLADSSGPVIDETTGVVGPPPAEAVLGGIAKAERSEAEKKKKSPLLLLNANVKNRLRHMAMRTLAKQKNCFRLNSPKRWLS